MPLYLSFILRRRIMSQKSIICLVGESGSGKTTLAEKMEAYGYKQIPSYTTRPKRYEGEKHKTFVDTKGFDEIRHDLIAYTLFDGYEYGTTMQQLLEHHLYVVDPDGVNELKKHVSRENIKVVYLKTNPLIRFERMKEIRGEEEAHKRMTHDLNKFSKFHCFCEYDITLSNNNENDLKDNEAVLLALLRQWFPKK